MIDREKVIKGLECCTFILGKRKCNECPYQKGLPDNGCYQLQDDFHSLLKEQDAKTGHWIFESQYCEAWSHKCSECGKRMTTAVNTFANWCWNCGAKMTDGR